MTNNSSCLPADFSKLPLGESTSLICVCGHSINCHAEGVSYYSPCEEDDGFCGCIYPEVDYDLTKANTYFFKQNGYRIAVAELTADCKKILGWFQRGMPAIFEHEALVVKIQKGDSVV